MVCPPESPVTKASSSEEATTPTPGSPESLPVTTPASRFERPTNPTPNSSKGKGKGIMAPPVTPKNHESRSLLSPGQPSTVSSLTPRSMNIRQVATSPDGVVFTFSSPETRSVASPLESWENAITFRQCDDVQFATPSGSNRTVVTNRQGSTGIRSWFTIPDSADYNVEEQPLLNDPLTLAVPQRHDYGALPRPTHADIHPDFWDCFSQTEMLIICSLLIGIILCVIWTVMNAITNL
ncbi:hypothetical protein F4813DRAFT_393487 [Daldinia decipiens]|uniref:uncharacterized protein n=1 Tax=Daldinia decipiens TaxID=326647 RepID=UPI0020C35920|nr:uncharacterized protein F4813DRAFT_393487 [Daldinia decipiens]KAI1653588.1 hypothetical protein F4813DRAFT_393487 [Daldinia decipiens]